MTKDYGKSASGQVITEEIAQQMANELEQEDIDLSKVDVVIRRPGRPARKIDDPGLESRLAANREQVQKALTQREMLILTAVKNGWPRRRIAESLNVGLGTVSRTAKRLAEHGDINALINEDCSPMEDDESVVQTLVFFPNVPADAFVVTPDKPTADEAEFMKALRSRWRPNARLRHPSFFSDAKPLRHADLVMTHGQDHN